MAKEIKTEILINANTEKVWSIFSDFKNYPNWNPFIKFLAGRVEVGKKITATSASRCKRNDVHAYRAGL
jgi:hypothetical protein